MIENRSAARRLKRSIQFTAAAAALLACAPAARAQGLFSFFSSPSPYDIERRLDASGYAMTGPLMRRGDVYLADVVIAGRRDSQRLVIDAQTGRIIERYRVQPSHWRDAPREADSDTGFWGPDPRPPGEIDHPRPPRDEFAREEDPALGTGAPRTTPSDLTDQPDRPKLKPHEAKHKSSPIAKTPAPSPSSQSEASTGPAATAPAGATPSAPAAAATKSEPPAAAAAPAPTPSATVTAKTDGGATPSPAAKAPSPPAEATDAKPASKTKAVNDLPVTPLD